MLICFSHPFNKFMDMVSSDATNQDIQPKCSNDMATSKRSLEGEGTVPSEAKRAKIDGDPDTGPDKGSYASDLPGTPETTHKSQKGRQGEKNKGRRRGTRPQVEDHPDRPKIPRLPKKQCAILIGFSGTNYAGMQM